MRRTVLVFTVDMVPIRNRHVGGGGLRAWSLGEALKGKGCDVVYSIPKRLVESEQLTGDLAEYAFQPENLRRVIRKVVPDVILFEQWGLVTFLEDTGVPVAIDLHGSLILENHFRRHGKFHYNAAAKIKAFNKADFFICPSARQKSYFQTWSMLAGLSPDEERFAIVPVSLSPDLPEKGLAPEPIFIFGGGLWPWIDPYPALGIVAQEISGKACGRLKLFTQKPKLESILPKDDILREGSSDTDCLAQYQGVEFVGFIPHDQMLGEYSQASAAVDLYQRNMERELAFSTRTIEYLWCGLPVIHADYSDISSYIREYQAGWCLNPNDTEAIRATVLEILSDAGKVNEYGRNAQKLVRDHFTWDKTIEPLYSFISNPPDRSVRRTFFDAVSLEFDRIETELEAENRKTREVLAEKTGELMCLRQSRDGEVLQAQEKVQFMDQEIRRLQDRLLEEVRIHSIELEGVRNTLTIEIKNRDDEICRLKPELENTRNMLTGEIKSRDDEICKLRSEMADAVARLNEFEQASAGYRRQLDDMSESVSKRDEEIDSLRHRVYLSTEQVRHFHGVLKSIQNRFLYKAYKFSTRTFKRLFIQYPRFFYLLAANFATNAYMSRLHKRSGRKIFPAQ